MEGFSCTGGGESSSTGVDESLSTGVSGESSSTGGENSNTGDKSLSAGGGEKSSTDGVERSVTDGDESSSTCECLRTTGGGETFIHYKPSPPQHHKRCQVYMSFLGTDVRTILVDHLLDSLTDAGLNVFRDTKSLEKGKNIVVRREEALRNSTLFIPIFSTGYASSPCRLKELCLSCSCKSIIIPLYYNVKPSDLTCADKKGPYARAFQQYRKGKIYSEEEMDAWKKALQRVSLLPGWASRESVSGLRGKLVEEVVSDLLETLHVDKHPQGLSDRMEDATRLLERKNLGHVLDVAIEKTYTMGDLGEKRRRGIKVEKRKITDCQSSDMEGCSSTGGETLKNYEPSPAQHYKSYDVYLSFGPRDVTNTLVYDLYNSLSTVGLNVFVDSSTLEKGKNIVEVIRNSTVFIPILSPGYASSPWCLKILSLRWTRKSIIIPLYYNVRRSDLRDPDKKDPYARAFQQHKKGMRYSEKEMDAWKKALHRVSFLVGWTLQLSKRELLGKLVNQVVSDIRETFNTTSLHVDKHPAGLSDRMEDVNNHSHVPDVAINEIDNHSDVADVAMEETDNHSYLLNAADVAIEETDNHSHLLNVAIEETDNHSHLLNVADVAAEESDYHSHVLNVADVAAEETNTMGGLDLSSINWPRSMSMGASVDSSAQSLDCFHYIRGFIDAASASNWTVIALILGNYGLSLSIPVFWLCWSIVGTEAVMFYSFGPYWKWIESVMPVQTADALEDSKKPHQPSDHGRAGTVFLKVGMSLALIAMLIYIGDLNKRQNKILLSVGLSIILLQGFPAIFIATQGLESLMQNPSGKGMQMIWSITGGQDWNVAYFSTTSVINSMIGVTGGIVLGGSLSSLMTQKSYWIFVSIVVVDMTAEAIYRLQCGNISVFASIPETKPSRHYISMVLRLVVEGYLCYWMAKEISQKSYFTSQVNASVCDGSKSLLITMVVLGGLQAAGTFTTALRSCLLRPQYAPHNVWGQRSEPFFGLGLFQGLPRRVED